MHTIGCVCVLYAIAHNYIYNIIIYTDRIEFQMLIKLMHGVKIKRLFNYKFGMSSIVNSLVERRVGYKVRHLLIDKLYKSSNNSNTLFYCYGTHSSSHFGRALVSQMHRHREDSPAVVCVCVCVSEWQPLQAKLQLKKIRICKNQARSRLDSNVRQ